MILRTSYNRVLLTVILLFPLSTLIQGLPYMDSINRILMVGILSLLCLSVFHDAIRGYQLILLVLALILTACMVLFSPYFTSINFFIYFPFWVLYFIYIKRYYEDIRAFTAERLGLIQAICLVSNLILFLSFFSSSSYQQIHGWGDESYFSSFAGSEHRLATVCIFLIVFAWLLAMHKKKIWYYGYALIPLVGLLLCGARTYLIIMAFLLGCIGYSLFTNKRLFYALLPAMAVLLVIIVLSTPSGEKFLYTLAGEGYGGYWFVFTNSRNVIWALDLRAFMEFPLVHKLLGGGEGIVQKIHLEAGFAPIWAHNDFIQILLVNGIVGLTLYLSAILSFTVPLIRDRRRFGDAPLISIASFYLIWFFAAMFNGYYTYVCSMLLTPFLTYAIFHQNEIRS